jgi:hypothetical protein
MKFMTVTIVKHPVDDVWKAMRDDLPLVTSKREDIHGVAEQERRVEPPVYRIVNIWTANAKLPQAILRFLGTDKIAWTDRAEWDETKKICTWSIEPHQFRDAIVCRGCTVFESALGGTGSKVTFSGDLDWRSDKLPGIAAGIGQAVQQGAEGVIRNVIQKNFRTIAEAVEKHLTSKSKR